MLLTEQNLEYVLESVIDTLIQEGIEINEQLLDECLEEVLSESTRSKMKNINKGKKHHMHDYEGQDDTKRSRTKIRKQAKSLAKLARKKFGAPYSSKLATSGVVDAWREYRQG